MINSMTGFGKAGKSIDNNEIAVEINTVNHRFLDFGIRLPYSWSSLEPIVRETVKKHIDRGKVSVTVVRKKGQNPCQSIKFDREIASQYAKAADEIGNLLGTDATLTPSVLAQLEGVFYQAEPEEEIEKIKDIVVEALTEALINLKKMRSVEGKALADEIVKRLGLIRESLAVIEQILPELNTRFEDRLRARIVDLGNDLSLTEERIAMEVAIMADKGDVTEEIVRLKAHLNRAEELGSAEEAVGREYNFLTQEIQREINTLGSKVRDTNVIGEVMRMKSELEKIREQVQNIE